MLLLLLLQKLNKEPVKNKPFNSARLTTEKTVIPGGAIVDPSSSASAPAGATGSSQDGIVAAVSRSKRGRHALVKNMAAAAGASSSSSSGGSGSAESNALLVLDAATDILASTPGAADSASGSSVAEAAVEVVNPANSASLSTSTPHHDPLMAADADILDALNAGGDSSDSESEGAAALGVGKRGMVTATPLYIHRVLY